MSVIKIALGIAIAGTTGISGAYTIKRLVTDNKEETEKDAENQTEIKEENKETSTSGTTSDSPVSETR